MVVMGTGVMPDVMLARAAGLELGETGGVACSADLETSARGVWAAGDMCEFDSVLHGGRVRIEHHLVARAQGRAARPPRCSAPGARTQRCRTSGPTWRIGARRNGSASPRRPSARSCAAASRTAPSASCTWPAAGSSPRCRWGAARTWYAQRLIAEATPLDGREAELAEGDLEAL